MSDTAANVDDPTALTFVGEATAEVIASADFDTAAIRRREVSYEMLVEAGVNPGVAARIRREHSLPWAFDHTDGERLRRRSDHVRNMQDGERAWIDETVDGWAGEATTDGGLTDEEAEHAWRERS